MIIELRRWFSLMIFEVRLRTIVVGGILFNTLQHSRSNQATYCIRHGFLDFEAFPPFRKGDSP